MTDEEAVRRFPKAKAFIEVPDDKAPLGAFGVIVTADGTAWIFEGDDDTARPITPDDLAKRVAFSCKPCDAVELIPQKQSGRSQTCHREP